jgi:GMP synthase (glutamine-hydrolysing)
MPMTAATTLITVTDYGDSAFNPSLLTRAVTSADCTTADFYPFPHDFPGRIATRIINKAPGIQRRGSMT